MALGLANILVAVDGLEQADYALNIATKIGERYSSKIDLVHVQLPTASLIDPKSPPAILVKSSKAASQTGFQERVWNVLSDRLEIVKERGLECTAVSIESSSNVASEILHISHSRSCDLIVLGSRGISGLTGLFVGSVSRKIAKEAKCSVLILKSRIASKPRLLVGYDGSTESNRALDFAEDLARTFGASVDIISVDNISNSPDGFYSSKLAKWEIRIGEKLESALLRLKKSGVPCNSKIVSYFDVPKALVEEANAGPHSMIVVGNRGHGRLKSLFLGSVACGVVDLSKTNVLIAR